MSNVTSKKTGQLTVKSVREASGEEYALLATKLGEVEAEFGSHDSNRAEWNVNVIENALRKYIGAEDAPDEDDA